MSVKEQIAEQLELLPEGVLIQIYEIIQVFKRSAQFNQIPTAMPDNVASPDPLIGLFSGSPDLATEAENILTEEINPDSGWTWKALIAKSTLSMQQ